MLRDMSAVSLAKCLSRFVVSNELNDTIDVLVARVARHDLWRFRVAERVRDSLDVERHDRAAGGHGFEDDVRHAFPAGGGDEEVGGGENRGDVVAPAGEVNALGDFQSSRSVAKFGFERARADNQ